MAAMKCPNPNCSFLFDPSQVPPGAVIGCPTCGMQFTLPPQAAVPPGYGAPPPGYPQPFSSAAPAGAEVTQMLQDEPAAYTPPRENRTGKKSGGGAGGLILAVGGAIGVLMVIGTVIMVSVFVKRSRLTAGPVATSGEFRKTDYNFAFAKPAGGWAMDPDTQNALGVNVLGFKRADPDAWLALGVRDYETRMPRPSEMKDKMLDNLAKAFENLPPELEPEPVTWAGQKADRYTFRAVFKPTAETCAVECTVLGHQGIAYWYFTWVAEANEPAAAEQLAAIRDGFRVLTERANWRPTTVTEAVHRSKSGLFKITDFERVWAVPQGKDPADEDEKADLVMTGILKGRDRRDVWPKAELVVFVLDDAADPLAAGKTYIRERYKTFFDETTFEDLSGPPEGDAPLGTEDNGTPVARMKVVRGGADSTRSADKLLLLSAVTADDKMVVAELTCPWRERIVWERRLMQMASSLKAAR
ncbi:MAG: hypothetical protein ACRC7O_12185 [Fimbriiglobus sp.]